MDDCRAVRSNGKATDDRLTDFLGQFVDGFCLDGNRFPDRPGRQTPVGSFFDVKNKFCHGAISE